jgi:hypothetical protein
MTMRGNDDLLLRLYSSIKGTTNCALVCGLGAVPAGGGSRNARPMPASVNAGFAPALLREKA